MYHVTPDGPRRCTAKKGGCPYASQANSHFDSADKAQHQFEKNMKAQYGVVPTPTRMARTRLRTYRRLDEGAKLKAFLSHPSKDNYYKYRQMAKVRRALNDRDHARYGRGGSGGSRGGSARSRRRGSLPTRMLRGTLRAFTRPVVKSVKKMGKNPKKLLLTKYWMPDIHSNKWR